MLLKPVNCEGRWFFDRPALSKNFIAERFGKTCGDFKTPIIELGGSVTGLKCFWQGLAPNTINVGNASCKIRSQADARSLRVQTAREGLLEAGAEKIVMDGGAINIDYTETLGCLHSKKTGVWGATPLSTSAQLTSTSAGCATPSYANPTRSAQSAISITCSVNARPPKAEREVREDMLAVLIRRNGTASAKKCESRTMAPLHRPAFSPLRDVPNGSPLTAPAGPGQSL